MSSICWMRHETTSGIGTDLRRRAYLVTFFVLLWSINLAVVLFGLPFILLGKVFSARGRS